jgi:mycofactocin system transcriptional regulator
MAEVGGNTQYCGRGGRRRVTTHLDLEHVALDLFTEHGYEATTVDQLALAAGMSRRTFFRYYPSKNDIAWGGFDRELERLRRWLRDCAPGLPVMDAIRQAVVACNRLDPDEIPWHRKRMALILRVPALQAHSTLRYVQWRQVIADFVAPRLGHPADSLVPQAIAYAALGVAIAAHERWLAAEHADLPALLDIALRELASGFTLPSPARVRGA